MRKTALDILLALPLLIAAWFFFSPMLDGGFLTDDYHNIRFATYGPEGSSEFDSDNPWEALTYFHQKATDRFELYRPLIPVSVRASYEYSGLEPRPWIATNIVLHLLGAILVIILTRTLFPEVSRIALLCACALFTFSPLQTQVAYWTSARSDSLCWIFGALALILKIGNPQRVWIPLACVWLSMMSKEAGLVFLGLVGFCDLAQGLPEEAGGARNRISRFAAALVSLAIYIGIRSYVFGDLAVGNAYGSKDFWVTLKADGIANLKSGFVTAMAPVTDVIFDHESWRLPLKIVFIATNAVIGFAGLTMLAKRGFFRFLVVAGLMVGPFVMASLVSRLDERFINTRGCYVPLFALSTFLSLIVARFPRSGIAISLLIVGASLPVSWSLQEKYVLSAKGTEQIIGAMQAEARGLDHERFDRVAVLNFQHLTWFLGGFSAAGCLPPAMMRPQLDADLETNLVTLDGVDPNRAFLTPFKSAFVSGTECAVFEMHFVDENTGYEFLRRHPRALSDENQLALTSLAPAKGSVVEIDLKDADSLVPRFVVEHDGGQVHSYRVSLFNPRGRVIDTIAKVEKVDAANGKSQVHLALPALPARMALACIEPQTFVWIVYAEDSAGKVLGWSPFVHYVAQTLKTMIRINEQLEIADEEIVFEMSRGGGPGGQKVNKTSSRITLIFDVDGSPSLSEEQRRVLLNKLQHRLTKEGILRLDVQSERSVESNKRLATERFVEIFREALRRKKAPQEDEADEGLAKAPIE